MSCWREPFRLLNIYPIARGLTFCVCIVVCLLPSISAQSGIAGSPYTVAIISSATTGINWTLSASSPGRQALRPMQLSSDSAPPFTLLQFNSSHQSIDNNASTSWMSGDSCWVTVDSQGSPGVKLVSSDSNVPAARYAALTWTGLDGHLYLFGQLTHQDC